MEGYVSALDEEPDAEESPPWPCAEASDDAIVEDVDAVEDLQIPRINPQKYMCRRFALRLVGELQKQRNQAIKQARHWQAKAQQQRAKVCKLEAENKELLQWVLHIENEDEDAKQQPGESFSQWEERQNFPPGVPLPSWPLSDFQDDPPVLVPKQPVGPPPSYLRLRFKSLHSWTTSSSSSKATDDPKLPVSEFQDDPPVPVPKQPAGPPPSYLIKRFKSQTSSSSSKKVVLGLDKATAIGRKLIKKRAKQTWAKAPMP